MSARDELTNLVRNSEVMSQMLRDIEQEPVRLLCSVCRDHAESGRPVPDHRLMLSSYFAETGLRSLVSAGLLKQNKGGDYSIYEYEPTSKGQDLYRRLSAEGGCDRP